MAPTEGEVEDEAGAVELECVECEPASEEEGQPSSQGPPLCERCEDQAPEDARDAQRFPRRELPPEN